MKPHPATEPALSGARVLITRAVEDAADLTHLLEGLGAEVSLQPTIQIVPPVNPIPRDSALSSLTEFHWIVFSSRYAVRAVFQRLRELGSGLQLPPALRVTAVGAATEAELRENDVETILLPGDASADGLVSALVREGVAGKRVLLPGADLARPELRRGLEAAGALVVQVVAYRTVIPERVDRSILDALCGGNIDVVAAASPSAIRNLVAMLGPDAWCLQRVGIACIGATTGDTATRLGLHPQVAPCDTSSAGLAEAVVAAFVLTRKARPE